VFTAHAESFADARRGVALAAAGAALRAAGDPRAHIDDRVALHRDAARWLRRTLEAFRSQLALGGAAAARAHEALQAWADARELASVRAPEGLSALPDTEAAAWRALWSEIAELRGRRW
jgi:hypothetical protein